MKIDFLQEFTPSGGAILHTFNSDVEMGFRSSVLCMIDPRVTTFPDRREEDVAAIVDFMVHLEQAGDL